VQLLIWVLCHHLCCVRLFSLYEQFYLYTCIHSSLCIPIASSLCYDDKVCLSLYNGVTIISVTVSYSIRFYIFGLMCYTVVAHQQKVIVVVNLCQQLNDSNITRQTGSATLLCWLRKHWLVSVCKKIILFSDGVSASDVSEFAVITACLMLLHLTHITNSAFQKWCSEKMV